MSHRKETIGDLLVMAPWWISAALGVLAYVGLRWLVPSIAGENQIGKALATGISALAPLAALFFVILAVVSALFGAKRRRRLVDEQINLETLRATAWKDFEFLVAEAYRRQGFTVEYSLGKGADGGVDLVLRRGGRTALVQCKQWKEYSVGAPVVREMFGILTAEGADEAIIVTSGRFTKEAEAFANGKPITLLDGPQLLDLVKSVQAVRAGPVLDAKLSSMEPEAPESPDEPKCPRCGSGMVLRTARRGTQAGEKFLGCTNYPRCKGTRPV